MRRAAVLAVLLVGCAGRVVWATDDGRPVDSTAFDRDRATCNAQKAQTVAAAGAVMNDPGGMVRANNAGADVFNDCMRGKGWVLVREQ